MRQLAWLRAVPRDPSARRKPGEDATPMPSRMERMLAEGIEPPLPPLPDAGAHLVAHLMEVGPVANTGFGPAAIAWAELHAWQLQTGMELDAWEARTLRRLSGLYVSETQRAASAAEPPPWGAPATAEHREALERRLRQQLAAERLASEHDQAARAGRRNARGASR